MLIVRSRLFDAFIGLWSVLRSPFIRALALLNRPDCPMLEDLGGPASPRTCETG